MHITLQTAVNGYIVQVSNNDTPTCHIAQSAGAALKVIREALEVTMKRKIVEEAQPAVYQENAE